MYPSLSSGLRQDPRQDTEHGQQNAAWVLVRHGPQASVSVQDTGERTTSSGSGFYIYCLGDQSMLNKDELPTKDF